jgi:hypothetical protein
MKKNICNKEYNTESTTLVHKYTVGMFGDPTGYEETLYQTADGYYFVYTFGGSESKYPVENISRIAKTKVDGWIACRA